MRSGDPFDPPVDVDVAGGHESSDPLAQHLHARAGDGVDTGLAQRRQRTLESEIAAIGQVADVLRAVRVQVHLRGRRLHGAGDGEVGTRVFLRWKEALHAELGGTELPRIRRDRGDVVEREGRRIAACRGAEAARGQVAVDHEAHRLADGIAAHVVGRGGDCIEVCARSLEQADPISVVECEGIGCCSLGQLPDGVRRFGVFRLALGARRARIRLALGR